MSRRQRVGILPLMILSVVLSDVTAIASHHQRGGRDARLVVASSTGAVGAHGDLHYYVRREKEAASRYARRHALQLRRVAEAKAAAARQRVLRARRRSIRPSTPVVPTGWQSWAASSGVVALRTCESGNDYTRNTGNGFSGAYQFDDQTWQALGGSGEAWQNPPAVQDQLAYRLYESRGSEPWPVCGRYL